MHTDTYQGATAVTLSEFIPTKNFRIVENKTRHVSGGISEIRVKIKTERPFEQSLTYPLANDHRIYGFVKQNDRLREELREAAITRIELYDWDDQFMMFFNYESQTKKAFRVKIEEVKSLLEHCLRPNILS